MGIVASIAMDPERGTWPRTYARGFIEKFVSTLTRDLVEAALAESFAAA